MTTETVIIIVFVAVALLLLWVFLRLRQRGFPEAVQKQIRRSWRHILEVSDHNKAILEADKLLDFALKHKGYTGSLGAKLKASGSLFRNLNDVWYAHKLRNKIAHELHYKLSEKEYKKALKYFRQALQDVGAKL